MDKFENLRIDCQVRLQTGRLLIRPVMPGDGKQIFMAVMESREEFRKWLPWVDGVMSWYDSEQTVRRFYADFILGKSMHMGLFDQGNLVGMCSLNSISWNIPSGDIGYWVRLSEQGKGYAQEAVKALAIYALRNLNLKRLTITCDERNIKSRKVAERLGFQLETRGYGLIMNVQGSDLAWGYRYVLFDSSSLEDLELPTS